MGYVRAPFNNWDVRVEPTMEKVLPLKKYLFFKICWLCPDLRGMKVGLSGQVKPIPQPFGSSPNLPNQGGRSEHLHLSSKKGGKEGSTDQVAIATRSWE